MVDDRQRAEGAKRYAKSLSQLGAAMGITKQRAAIVSREPWFPPKGEAGWDVDEVLRARARRSRGEPVDVATAPAPAVAVAEAPVHTSLSRAIAASPGPAPPITKNELVTKLGPRHAPAAVVELGADDADADLIRILNESTDLLEVAKVTTLLAAKNYARHPRDDEAAETLQKAIDMRRKMENDGLELAKKRGELIARDVAIAIVGAYCRRFVMAGERMAPRFAAQVEMYLSDEQFKARPVEERKRLTRDWVQAQMRAVRLSEKDDEAHKAIESLVALELERREAKVRR